MSEHIENIKQIKKQRWLKMVMFSLLAAVIVSGSVYYAISSYVMSEAEENIQNILQSNRAVHQYIQQIMHPTFFRDRDKGKVPQDYYTPEIFSSSFIVRVMHNFHNMERVKLGLPEVYYKLASDNPRNPLNKADEFEMGLIRMFNEQRDMKQFRKIVTVDGKDYLYYAIPFLETSNACIRCHGKRSEAPVGLQRIYSGSGGFNELTGRIRAIESIRAPIVKEKYSLAITGSSIAVFAVVGLGMFFFNRKLSYDVSERTVDLEHEIKERVNTERELVVSRRQYQNLVEGTPDLITRVDKEGRLVFVNHAALNIFGVSPEECIGRLVFDFVHPEDRELTIKTFQDWLDGSKESFTFENRQVGIFGQEHFMSWSIRSEKDENGIVQGFAGTAHDITNRKRAEEEKVKLESQLQQAQKMESVGRLAGGVAHDFNNLLTVILGGAHLALSELEPGQPLYEYVTLIQNAGEKSAVLTQQLLAFARKQTIEPKVLDLNEIVSGMIKMLQRLIGENTQLTWQPANNLWPIKADPSQIDQILANLCVNARDSITDIGTITIQTGNSVVDEGYRIEHADVIPGEYVHISVCDNGCGMDKETMTHIFEPFFTTKGVGEGTGLGLATVYGAAKQNNGFVNVYSEPGIGTTFTIYLPRYVGSTDQKSAKCQTQTAPRGVETILLVEDEPAILNMTMMLLKKQGYTVMAADTPGEATRLANEHSGIFDLLITDVIMPEMNGKDLANNLKSLNPKLKCLFMSGYTADVIAHHGVLEEGMHFIHKPFALPDLAVKVRKVLDGKYP